MSQVQAVFFSLIDRLPSKHDREFETEIVDFVVGHSEANVDQFERELKKVMEHEPAHDKHSLSFIAFLALATYYRRNDYAKKHQTLFLIEEDRFKEYPIYYHFRSLMYKSIGETEKSINDALLCLEDDTLKYHPGILHNYAESVIELVERNDWQRLPSDDPDSLIEDSYKDLNKAIDLSKERYAKFFHTRARFKRHFKDFDSALFDVQEAIQLENRGHDYQLRLAKYYQTRSLIEVEKRLADEKHLQERTIDDMNQNILKAKHDFDETVQKQETKQKELYSETVQKLEGMKQQNLQILGFFTAIISFTVGSLQIIQTQTFPSAILLIVVLCGALLVAYAGFSSMLFHISESEIQAKKIMRKNLVGACLGLILIIFSIVAYHFEWLGGIPSV